MYYVVLSFNTFPMKTSGLAWAFSRVYHPLCWNLTEDFCCLNQIRIKIVEQVVNRWLSFENKEAVDLKMLPGRWLSFQNEVSMLGVTLPCDAFSHIFSMGVPHKVNGDVLPVVTMALNLFEGVVCGNVNYWWYISSRILPNFRKFQRSLYLIKS